MPPRSNYVGGNTRTASLIEREVSGHLSPSACHPFRELTARAFATLACHFKGILTKVAEVNQQMHSVTSRAHRIWTQILQPCMIMHAYCIECNFKTNAHQITCHMVISNRVAFSNHPLTETIGRALLLTVVPRCPKPPSRFWTPRYTNPCDALECLGRSRQRSALSYLSELSSVSDYPWLVDVVL